MMKPLRSSLCLLAASIFAATAAAQTTGRGTPPVPVTVGGDGIVDACSLGLIIGLDDPAVRTGPGTRFRAVDTRKNGQKVNVCGERGSWYAVVYHPSGEPENCGVSTPLPKRQIYRGPCRSGWIDSNTVDVLTD